jgi:hypothetical protein
MAGDEKQTPYYPSLFLRIARALKRAADLLIIKASEERCSICSGVRLGNFFATTLTH